MHGHHQDITKVNLLLTEPSQVSGVGPRELMIQAVGAFALPLLLIGLIIRVWQFNIQQQLDRANLIDRQQQTTLETYLDGPLCTDSVHKGCPEAQAVWLQVGGWAVRLVRFEKVRLPISHAKCDGRVMGKLPFVMSM